MKFSRSARVGPVCATVLVFAAISPAWADISFTPVAAYYFDNITQRQSATDFNSASVEQTVNTLSTLSRSLGATFSTTQSDSARNSSQLAFPQFGATLGFSVPGSDATQIALTALYGRTSESDTLIVDQVFNFGLAGVNVQDAAVQTTQRHGDFTRLDLEVTVQHRLNETFSLIAGARAERTNAQFTQQSTFVQSSNFENLVATLVGLPPILTTPQPQGVTRYDETSWIYSARLGAAAFAPVGDKHLFYVNGLMQVSYAPHANLETNFLFTSSAQESVTMLGPDISVGYLYRFSDRFALEFRYRATVYFPVSGPSDFKDSRVAHGPRIGFTTWIGSH